MKRELTDEQLDAIAARANAAQPGPWLRYTQSDHASLRSSNGEMVAGTFGWEWGGIEHEADADFIAHAREDVPALLAEVRRLRAAEQRVQALIQGDDYRWIESADEPGFTREQVADALAGIKRNWRGDIIEGPTEENQS